MFQTHVLADEMPELVGRDFSQTFESRDFGVGTQFLDGLDAFVLCIAIVGFLLVAYTRGFAGYIRALSLSGRGRTAGRK